LERRSRADEQLREYREGKQTLLRGSAGLYRALPERHPPSVLCAS
jgi:hypothetical protein